MNLVEQLELAHKAARAGNLRDAQERAFRVAALMPNNKELQQVCGIMLVLSGGFDRALPLLLRAGAEQSTDPLQLIVLAKCHASLQNISEALKVARRAAALAPNNDDVRIPSAFTGGVPNPLGRSI